ncbi:MAG: hypothetical protein HC869_15915 [Rhodospirillales bacterium]|nr:hypothetical protein [Rhodospirillales bacterium]
MKHLCRTLFLILAVCSPVEANEPAVEQRVIDVKATLTDVLQQRPQERTNIWIELALKDVPAVAERVNGLKAELDRNRRNNTICAGARGIVGKSGTVCNRSQFTVMILARNDGESVSANLRYFEDAADDPLRSSIRQFVQALATDSIDTGQQQCVRLVLRDPTSGQLDPVAPVLVLVRVREMPPSAGINASIAICLE